MSILFFSPTDMDGKSEYDDDMPSGLTPIVRTPSPYEFLPSYKLSEGNIYKSPIFIKNEETNTVPVLNDVNYTGEPDSRKSTNGLFCHEDYMYHPKADNKEEILENIMQDVTNVDKVSVINGATKQNITTNIKDPPAFVHATNKIDFYNCNVETLPRKARTRSVESAVWDIEEKRKRKGVKRPRSVETGPQTPSKLPKFDLKNYKTEKHTSQVPSIKQEHKQKEHRSKDKPEHREHKSSSSKSSHDRKRRSSIGIQARPSQDSGRHYLKLLEPRPCLLESGNLSYPPSDVSLMCL